MHLNSFVLNEILHKMCSTIDLVQDENLLQTALSSNVKFKFPIHDDNQENKMTMAGKQDQS